MFRQDLLNFRHAIPEDITYIMDRRELSTGITDPFRGTREEDMFCLEYSGEPIAICGMRLNSIYRFKGWGWCVAIKNLPIPVRVLAKISAGMCESYSERVDILLAAVKKGNRITRRFAEHLGFEMDKELNNKYNLQENDVMRYSSGRNRYIGNA